MQERSEVDDSLVDSIQKDDLDGVKQALMKGANANLRIDGMPILHYMALQERVPIMKELIGRGADVNATDKSGMTALMHAAMFGRGEQQRQIIDALIGAGADVDIESDSGRTAIELAANMHNASGVRMLHEAGAVARSGYRSLVQKTLGPKGLERG